MIGRNPAPAQGPQLENKDSFFTTEYNGGILVFIRKREIEVCFEKKNRIFLRYPPFPLR